MSRDKLEEVGLEYSKYRSLIQSQSRIQCHFEIRAVPEPIFRLRPEAGVRNFSTPAPAGAGAGGKAGARLKMCK